MIAKKWLILVLTIAFSTYNWAQTKPIAAKSHSGERLMAFEASAPDNIGIKEPYPFFPDTLPIKFYIPIDSLLLVDSLAQCKASDSLTKLADTNTTTIKVIPADSISKKEVNDNINNPDTTSERKMDVPVVPSTQNTNKPAPPLPKQESLIGILITALILGGFTLFLILRRKAQHSIVG